MRINAPCTATPNSKIKPTAAEILKCVPVTNSASTPPTKENGAAPCTSKAFMEHQIHQKENDKQRGIEDDPEADRAQGSRFAGCPLSTIPKAKQSDTIIALLKRPRNRYRTMETGMTPAIKHSTTVSMFLWMKPVRP